LDAERGNRPGPLSETAEPVALRAALVAGRDRSEQVAERVLGVGLAVGLADVRFRFARDHLGHEAVVREHPLAPAAGVDERVRVEHARHRGMPGLSHVRDEDPGFERARERRQALARRAWLGRLLDPQVARPPRRDAPAVGVVGGPAAARAERVQPLGQAPCDRCARAD
jgi:hypothetical protein